MRIRITRLGRGFAALAMLLAMMSGPINHAAAAPAQQAGPQTWTVLVGAQAEMEQTEHGTMGAWQIMKFFPDKLTINEGDTVIYKLNSAEMHNVVFPPPGTKYVPFVAPQGNEVVATTLSVIPTGGPTYDGTAAASAGLLSMEGQSPVTQYKLTFTKAGSYNYLCTIHSAQLPDGSVVGMTGNVTVQAAGSALAKTPAQVDADAQAAISTEQQSATAADAKAKEVTAPEAQSDGSMLYHVHAGFDTENAAYMRFSPGELTVHVGDTVMWTQTSAVTPHTITLPSGGAEPPIVVVTPQTGGPPKVSLNPQVLAPAGGTSYAGTGFFNSGFIDGTTSPAPGPRTYSLKFTTPGTYEFICILHDSMGMAGHVTVLPAGSTPGMPSTGNSADMVNMLVAGTLAIIVMVGGLALRRRHAHAAR